jgi:two-component sensor histidine kinase/putative methionine-R-sulfoxide reductase with GAF domain
MTRRSEPAEPSRRPFEPGALRRLIALLQEPAGSGAPDVAAAARGLGAEARTSGMELPATLDLLRRASEGATVPPQPVWEAVIDGWVSGGEARPVTAPSSGPLSSSVDRLTALHRIMQTATASLDLDAMLRTVVEVVRDTVSGDSCSIFLYDPSSNTLTLRATVGLNTEAVGRVTLALGTGITGVAAMERRLIAVPDATAHPSYLDYPLVGDQSYQSQVSVPLALRSPDRLVGVLNILTLRRREFVADELAFLETAAGEIAIAIENAQLYAQTDAELQRRISQLSTLQQMSRLVASTLDLPDLLRLISQQAVDLTGAVAVDLYRLPRRNPQQIELLSRYPEAVADELSASNDALRGLVAEVMGTGTSIWRRLDAPSGEFYVYALPMITGRRAVGALCVIHRVRPPDADDVDGLLHAFSDSAAIAIENAELYEEARRGYRRASTLLQEMHHRVRNNLQTVAALLSMQARRAGDAGWTAPLNQAVGRIQSIAAIHDLLSGGDIRETTIDAIARRVAEEASTTLIDPSMAVEFVVEPSTVRVSSREATILALLINEFIANAITHGLAGRSSGRIAIRADWRGDRAVVEVQDDGGGLPADFVSGERRGLGLQIARTLAQVDLRGEFSIADAHPGVIARVSFVPAEPASGS